MNKIKINKDERLVPSMGTKIWFKGERYCFIIALTSERYCFCYQLKSGAKTYSIIDMKDNSRTIESSYWIDADNEYQILKDFEEKKRKFSDNKCVSLEIDKYNQHTRVIKRACLDKYKKSLIREEDLIESNTHYFVKLKVQGLAFIITIKSNIDYFTAKEKTEGLRETTIQKKSKESAVRWMNSLLTRSHFSGFVYKGEVVENILDKMSICSK